MRKGQHLGASCYKIQAVGVCPDMTLNLAKESECLQEAQESNIGLRVDANAASNEPQAPFVSRGMQKTWSILQLMQWQYAEI